MKNGFEAKCCPLFLQALLVKELTASPGAYRTRLRDKLRDNLPRRQKLQRVSGGIGLHLWQTATLVSFSQAATGSGRTGTFPDQENGRIPRAEVLRLIEILARDSRAKRQRVRE